MKVLNLAIVLILLAKVAHSERPLQTVDRVDLDRYLGTWYEIASLPAWFQKNCTGVTAEYTLQGEGLIQVVNRCYKGSLDGRLKQVKGRARILDTETNAKLKVSFFRPFWGNYWIIDLDPDYEWAVVGEPKRKYLWILSRTPTLEKETLDGILSRLPAQGYDIERLEWTVQADTAEKS
jgi:apolipoprotein D and lipocalin family protein